MNILQITSDACAPMSANDNNGINRVVTALCKFYVEVCRDTCFNAYYRVNPNGLSRTFYKGYQLSIPIHESTFKDFLETYHIEVIVINVCDAIYVKEIPAISNTAHKCNIPTIYCIHFMPGYEAYSYADFSMVRYGITHRTQMMNTIKKWLITIGQPLSAQFILRKMQNQYVKPLNTCDKVVVFTQPYIQQYLKVVNASTIDKFAAIPNPLSFSSFISKDELIQKEKIVIVVGRLYEHQKRLSYTLRTWKMIEHNQKLTDWKLMIIGEGTSKGYYQWLVQKYNLKNVTFVGSHDPQPYYKIASILLSTSAYEGWPMVLMECMPMGVVPCVFDSYCATREIIDHGVNGMIAPDNDLNTFYHYLEELMLDDSKRLQMAEAAITKSQAFDMSIIGKRWKKLFLSIQRE